MPYKKVGFGGSWGGGGARTPIIHVRLVGRALSFLYLIFYDKFIRVGRTRGNIF